MPIYTLRINPFELPRTSRFALALLSSLLTGLFATLLFQWNSVRAIVDQPERIPARVSDTDRDGLADLEELAYYTRIYSPDSDGDGTNDGEEIRAGRNPNGEGALPSSLTKNNTVRPDRDHDGLADEIETSIGTNVAHADSDGDGFPDGLEMENGYDPTGQGRPAIEVVIPSLKIRAPLVWTEIMDEKSIEQDLQRGVIHLPGTAAPGETGNVFITGHSSDYFWQRGPYRDIFKDLPQLKEGDEVLFLFTYANGSVREVKYRLKQKMVVSPSDRSLLSPTHSPILTLVTCYPIGSNTERLAWRGALIE